MFVEDQVISFEITTKDQEKDLAEDHAIESATPACNREDNISIISWDPFWNLEIIL